LRNTLRTLIAAAGIVLAAAVGVSCGGGGTVEAEVAPPQPDTLALVDGLRLFEEAEYDLARDRLLESARSTSTYIRAESFLYLNALEMELGNYDAAQPWLERYHAETVRLLSSAADASRRMSEQAARLQRRHDALVVGLVCVAVVALGVMVFWLLRRRGGAEVSVAEVGAAAVEVDISDWRRHLADAEAFRGTEVWAEVLELAAQKPGRDARVLSLARQEVLDAELAVRFADFATRLRADWPALTAGDVKLCCLSLLPLTPFGRALCFGSTETNIVKQRKHLIKKKLAADSRNPHGPALFEFIFSGRG
jgi:hypothetical protein